MFAGFLPFNKELTNCYLHFFTSQQNILVYLKSMFWFMEITRFDFPHLKILVKYFTSHFHKHVGTLIIECQQTVNSHH